MKINLLLILFCLLAIQVCGAQCSDQSLTLNSQDAVDDFAMNYPNVVDWSGTLYISGSDISNLNGLSVIESICGNLSVSSTSLTNLAGLENLMSVDGQFFISSNNLLVNLEGLENLSYVNFMYINANPVLLNLNGLTNLGTANSFTLYGNEAITTLEGWSFNSAHLENLSIYLNDSLENVDALTNITSIGRLEVLGNNILNGFQGLENLTSLGYLFIMNSPSLTSLEGLENLTILKGLFFRNVMLTSLDAIANVEIPDYNPLTDSEFPSIIIEDCQNLSECSIAAICEQISNPNFYFEIDNNAIGCESVPAILDSCQNLGVSDINPSSTKIYPSIADNIVNISGGEFSQVQIFDVLGKIVLETKIASNSFNIEKLSAGRYIVRLRDNNNRVMIHDLIVK
ncbi:MAG: T9SS type A sorting domain-containing protein [Aquaticitalea sp.]